MACMCGDICCSSCGPAQGNSRCSLCGAWMSDGCEHYDEETGKLKPKFAAELGAVIKAENEAIDAAYRDMEMERVQLFPCCGVYGLSDPNHNCKVALGACCPQAERLGCVCDAAWRCQIHGDKHLGAHD